LPVEVRGHGRGRRLAVRAPKARVLEVGQPEDVRLSNALRGHVPGKLPPVLMDGGRRWWISELVDENSVRTLVPRWDAISTLARAHDAMGLCVFARCVGRDYDLVVRALVGHPAQDEDAASGAANATLAAYLHERGELPRADGRYVVSQGREVGHDARLELRVDAEGEVWSGGQVQTVVRGTIDWETTNQELGPRN
jgi:PhzF family phenazine biosynthesis protein